MVRTLQGSILFGRGRGVVQDRSRAGSDPLHALDHGAELGVKGLDTLRRHVHHGSGPWVRPGAGEEGDQTALRALDFEGDLRVIIEFCQYRRSAGSGRNRRRNHGPWP